MTDIGYVLLGLLVLFGACLVIYLCARLVTAAYFRSKHDHEQRKLNHERKKQP